MKDKKTFGVKALAALAAVALALGCVIGGTMAWLTDKTGAVTNTFTTSDIDITLEETGAINNANSYKMIPGYTITKDPKVTVEANSEKCYLFVKVEKSDNFDHFMTYEIASGWKQLKDAEERPVSGVFYQTVESSKSDQKFFVIKNNTVTVQGTVTKSDMKGLNTDTYPTLTVTAYAAQFYEDNNSEFKPYEAWNIVNPTT